MDNLDRAVKLYQPITAQHENGAKLDRIITNLPKRTQEQLEFPFIKDIDNRGK